MKPWQLQKVIERNPNATQKELVYLLGVSDRHIRIFLTLLQLGRQVMFCCDIISLTVCTVVLLYNQTGRGNHIMAETKERRDTAVKPEHVRFKRKSQVTVPRGIVEALDLQEGDDLQVRLENGKIVFVPMVSIPKDQAWFWSEQWQKEEAEVEEHIKAGRLTEPKSLDDTLNDLDRLSKE